MFQLRYPYQKEFLIGSMRVYRTPCLTAFGTPLFRKRCPFTQSSCVITTLVCGYTLLKISTFTNTCTSK